MGRKIDTLAGQAEDASLDKRLAVVEADYVKQNAVSEAKLEIRGWLIAQTLTVTFAVVGMSMTMFLKVDALEDRVARLETRVDQLEARVERMEGRLNGIEGRLDKIEGKLDAMDGQLREIREFMIANPRR